MDLAQIADLAVKVACTTVSVILVFRFKNQILGLFDYMCHHEDDIDVDGAERRVDETIDRVIQYE